MERITTGTSGSDGRPIGACPGGPALCLAHAGLIKGQFETFAEFTGMRGVR